MTTGKPATLKELVDAARQHGNYACYVAGCRLDDGCRAANTERSRRIRARYRTPRPPRFDVDEAAVQRAILGDPPTHLTQGEREEAVRRLHAARLNDPQISDRTGITARTVLRIRNRLGLPSWHPEYAPRKAAA